MGNRYRPVINSGGEVVVVALLILAIFFLVVLMLFAFTDGYGVLSQPPPPTSGLLSTPEPLWPVVNISIWPLTD
jgi:hypothetical protein